MTPDTPSAPASVSASGRPLAPSWWWMVAMIWSGQAFSVITNGADSPGVEGAQHRPGRRPGRTGGQIRQGWRALSTNLGLVVLIAALTVGMMVFAAIEAVYPLMAKQHFGADGAMVSLAEAITGSCMLVGALIMMAWGGGKRLALLMSCATMIVAPPIAVIGLLPTGRFWALVALMGFACVFLAWFHAPLMTLIQKHVGEDKAGRALGFFQMMIGLAVPSASPWGGAIAERTSVPALFTAAGLVFGALGVFMRASPSVRALDAPAPGPSTAVP